MKVIYLSPTVAVCVFCRNYLEHVAERVKDWIREEDQKQQREMEIDIHSQTSQTKGKDTILNTHTLNMNNEANEISTGKTYAFACLPRITAKNGLPM